MAQIEGPKLLGLLEKANELAFWDLECTNLQGDYGSILVGSIRPLRGSVKTFTVEKAGDDKLVAEAIRDELNKYTCWVGFFSKLFDFPMLQARLLVNGSNPILKRHHIDIYFILKQAIKTSRHSQAHYLSLLGTQTQKMSIGANQWNVCLDRTTPEFDQMIKRCESDTLGLRDLFKRTRHLIMEITR